MARPAYRPILFALLPLTMLPLAACATRPFPDEVFNGCRGNAMEMARAAEPRLLAAGQSERRDDTLILKPAHGDPVVLRDGPADCELQDVSLCGGFALVGVSHAAHAWVVQRFHFEGADYLLIDTATGRRIPLNGMPVFSPDGNRFLVAPLDEENDVGPNNLEIWQRQGDGAVLEWAHTFQQAQAEDPSLSRSYEVHVRAWRTDRITLGLSMPCNEPPRWQGNLVRSENGWHLSVKSPPGLEHPATG